MGRSKYRTEINCSVKEAYARAVEVLREFNYGIKDHRGEQVWKEGIGMLSAMHFIKISFPDDRHMQVSGWIQSGLGSVGFKDNDLHGAYGVVPKKKIKKAICGILSAVSSDPVILRDVQKYVNDHDRDDLPELPSYEDVMQGRTYVDPAGAAGDAYNAPEERNDASAPAGDGQVRFCPNCGGRITVSPNHTQSFIFCSFCGNKLDL